MLTLSSENCSGSIKRWNMARGPMSHGSKSKRQHGSIGSSATPSRVLPGLKMAGHMGDRRTTIRKLEVRGKKQLMAHDTHSHFWS